MNRKNTLNTLEELLKPVTDSLNREAAEKLARLRVNRKTQAHIDRLARRCTEGKITSEERAEYETWVHAIDLIAILQAKARSFLSHAVKP
jgi:hypothetical protein